MLPIAQPLPAIAELNANPTRFLTSKAEAEKAIDFAYRDVLAAVSQLRC